MVRVSQAALVEGAIAGKAISFPTDTVPALAALPERAALLFDLKQRPSNKPTILMGASWESLRPYVTGESDEVARWEQTVRKLWPGALTLVLPASDLVPPAMRASEAKTIGVRVPDLALARQILAATGPLATTSANRSGEAPLTTMAAIDAAFPEVLALGDGDITRIWGNNLPSTVARWQGKDWEILRRGSITEEALLAASGAF
ncbi:L-threonylcarbamoyladenylate synthase [Oscillatoria sp. FACHB-1406]|uniref:L-threonylcarbamoyladenylate synthase n=1 Tax=Oscillatoria sp. FACHB-1406 TaxID=2692846 RepID=UPI001684F6CC|nr:L-threonylcarbamoyladenylate synthase [Oscillatoria sp. FACHB-1406]MBD2577692.1 L-threonylcarbamoyladenylate synthase [Oscillatoria sp. FACHB-1406]